MQALLPCCCSLHVIPPSPAFPMQLCDMQDAVIQEMLASVQFFTSCTLRHGEGGLQQ